MHTFTYVDELHSAKDLVQPFQYIATKKSRQFSTLFFVFLMQTVASEKYAEFFPRCVKYFGMDKNYHTPRISTRVSQITPCELKQQLGNSLHASLNKGETTQECC
ncbi:hypothetical protein EGR_10458 [Echinococcus granulosus]|uniref:Uncharacterized protein n=1 Tax=Echinococcus granulosus TaxID=6210 RepID=W6U2A0_ECHGR|nr:hypothetical protein EGR_10458 [Echinococcus granulosus]EUB54676.1 hypothetical protein EGR_10458 [Echinococcus granulosus]